MKIRSSLFTAVLCATGAFAGYAADALPDLTVGPGETLTVEESAAYATVTVNGTLVVKSGKLSATEVRVGSGAGNEGALTIDGGDLYVGVEGDYNTPHSLYIGYNGGKGTVTIKKSLHTVRRTVFGHGGADGCELILNSGGILGFSLQKIGSGVSTVTFKGGRFELSGSSLISLDEGTLVFDAEINHAQIRFRRDGEANFFNSTSTHTGRLVTKGRKAMYLYYSDSKFKGVLTFNALADGRLNWGHEEGFLLYGHDQGEGKERYPGRYRVDDGDFFSYGSLQTVQIYDNQSLDVNGRQVRMKELLFKNEEKGVPARIWNSAATEGAIVLGTDSAGKVSVVKDCTWERNVSLVKTDASRLQLDLTPFNAPIAVNGGILEITNRVSVADISQTAEGKIRLTQTGNLGFCGRVWENPLFCDDSAGVIESEAAADGTNLMDAAQIDFKGNSLKVASGVLELGKIGEVSDRFFRFTLRRSYVSTPDRVELSELHLLDSRGEALSLGLVRVADGTAAEALEPGQCAYKAACSEGDTTSLENLFDGNTNSTVFIVNIPAHGVENDFIFVEPIVVHLRLPETAIAPAVSYSMRKGNDTNCSRNLTSWTLESSPDGIHWELVDQRYQPSYEAQVRPPHSEYKQSPFKFERALGALANLSFGENAIVEVAQGAVLDARTKSGGIPALKLDVQEYSVPALISSFPAAEGGKLYLENIQTGNGRRILPVEVGALSGNLGSWTAYAGGAELSGASLAVDRSGNLVLKCAPFHIIVR